jgi:hypothetical protein
MLLGPNLLGTKPVMSRTNSQPLLANTLRTLGFPPLPLNVINIP